jgi:hypothetical protein
MAKSLPEIPMQSTMFSKMSGAGAICAMRPCEGLGNDGEAGFARRSPDGNMEIFVSISIEIALYTRTFWL